MLTKVRGWQARLAAFLAARGPQPFAWGLQDCALFTCDAIEAMSGTDPAGGLRGYACQMSAQRKIVEFLRGEGNGKLLHGRSLLELVVEKLAAQHGLIEVHKGSVAAGDVALCAAVAEDRFAGGRVRIALAVVDVDGQVVSAGTHGLVRGERESIVRAWRIACA